jgi:hypothetical protein
LSAAPREAKEGLQLFEVPVFHRTLAEWINGVIDAGFLLAYFLHVQCRKPSA